MVIHIYIRDNLNPLRNENTCYQVESVENQEQKAERWIERGLGWVGLGCEQGMDKSKSDFQINVFENNYMECRSLFN